MLARRYRRAALRYRKAIAPNSGGLTLTSRSSLADPQKKMPYDRHMWHNNFDVAC